jgi:hypothetical protein
MGTVAETGQKNQRPSGTAPVEHLELDVFVDGDKLHGMRRRILLI